MNNSEVLNTKPLEQLINEIGVHKVFGDAHQEGDVTVIPVAQVAFGFGYGSGSEGRHGEEDSDDEDAEGKGSGGGAGAGGRATPRGFIRVADGKVSYQPIEDEKWVPLAGIFMVAWIVFWVMATVRAVAKQVGKAKKAKA